MYVITMASLKGGAGKTTLALHLAAAAEGRGIRTVVIDLDPQQAAAKWGDSRTGDRPLVVSVMAARLPRALEDAQKVGAGLVLIDTAAHAEMILNPAVSAADLVLIPCRPTVIDLQHVTATAELVGSRGKPGAVVLNAVQPRTNEVAEARALVEKLGIPLASAQVSHLVAHSRAITAGQGVTEFEPGGKAALEIEALFEWISLHLDFSTVGSVEQSIAAS